jgi:hypothetical protein
LNSSRGGSFQIGDELPVSAALVILVFDAQQQGWQT